jgi:hypothetical protein
MQKKTCFICILTISILFYLRTYILQHIGKRDPKTRPWGTPDLPICMLDSYTFLIATYCALQVKQNYSLLGLPTFLH